MVDRLKLCAHRCQYTPHQPLVEMKRILDALNKAFNKLVDMMLTKEMKVGMVGIGTHSSVKTKELQNQTYPRVGKREPVFRTVDSAV